MWGGSLEALGEGVGNTGVQWLGPLGARGALGVGVRARAWGGGEVEKGACAIQEYELKERATGCPSKVMYASTLKGPHVHCQRSDFTPALKAAL